VLCSSLEANDGLDLIGLYEWYGKNPKCEYYDWSITPPHTHTPLNMNCGPRNRSICNKYCYAVVKCKDSTVLWTLELSKLAICAPVGGNHVAPRRGAGRAAAGIGSTCGLSASPGIDRSPSGKSSGSVPMSSTSCSAATCLSRLSTTPSTPKSRARAL
jgi:hypothetical protein